MGSTLAGGVFTKLEYLTLNQDFPVHRVIHRLTPTLGLVITWEVIARMISGGIGLNAWTIWEMSHSPTRPPIRRTTTVKPKSSCMFSGLDAHVTSDLGL